MLLVSSELSVDKMFGDGSGFERITCSSMCCLVITDKNLYDDV